MVGATEGHWGMFSDPDGVAGEAQVQLLIATYLHIDVNKCLNMLSCCRLRGVLRLWQRVKAKLQISPTKDDVK